jgi:lysine 2,3-aminomutase
LHPLKLIQKTRSTLKMEIENRFSSLHLKTSCRNEVTSQGAKMFGVSEEQFSNWRWQMKNQITNMSHVPEAYLKQDIFHSQEKEGFKALNELFHAGLTPYYFSLIDWNNINDPVRIQSIPNSLETLDPLGIADPLSELNHSPVKELVHVYENRVAFCVAQACPVYCRYCFRKRRDEEIGLHFNPKIIEAGIKYISENKKIRDVLITGGDPLISQDNALKNLLSQLRNIKHVEIIRIGTRVPVALPCRITEELANMLENFHPLWINTHFNHANELTPEAIKGIDILSRRGIPIGNQSVLLKGVNDNFETLKELFEGLVKARVRPYYLYQAQIVEGTAHLRVPIETGLGLMKKLRGKTTGFALPQYVLDTPTGKIPLSPNHVIGRSGEFMNLEDIHGNKWSEPNPLY